jgi:hypothetical protein
MSSTNCQSPSRVSQRNPSMIRADIVAVAWAAAGRLANTCCIRSKLSRIRCMLLMSMLPLGDDGNQATLGQPLPQQTIFTAARRS